MDETKIIYVQDLIKKYGHKSGIKLYEVKPNQFRYRLRKTSTTIGGYITEKKALKILKKTQQTEELKKLQNLEDAFGPDDLYNPYELDIPLY
jgi:hypothetical protein